MSEVDQERCPNKRVYEITEAAPTPSRLGSRIPSRPRTLGSGTDTDTGVSQIEAALHGRHDVALGGADVAGKQVGEQALTDLGFAEALAFPLLAILAVLIFRGGAALLPLAAGGLSARTVRRG